MAYNALLADRIRNILDARSIVSMDKKMMGGLTFMVDAKMCVGVHQEKLMARIDPAIYEDALKQPGCIAMDFTGRPMKGFVFVLPEGTDDDDQLSYWIDLALEYNPRARSSKKRKKKKGNN